MLVDTRTVLVDQTGVSDSHRRGPMRPGQLLSVRQRQSRRLAGHRFRAVDTLVLLVISIVGLRTMVGTTVSTMPVADVAPVAIATWASWRLLRAMGLYRLGRAERLGSHLARVLIAVGGAFGAAWLTQLALPTGRAASDALFTWAAWSGGGLLMLHVTWWGLVNRWRSQGWLTPNLVVVGATAHADDLIATAIDRRDMNILGVFDDRRERSPLAVRGVPVLGATDDMLEHRIMPYVDLVVVTIDQAASSRVRDITARLSVLPNAVTLLFDDPVAGRRASSIDQLADAPLAPLHPAADADRRAFAKRAQDLVIGLVVAIVAAPFLALIALAVRLDSPGPVFFRQRRHGFNNEEIVVWKFRTMRHEAADARAERQVTAGDDRVTRVGRILRSTSLDEVPQLFNVIAGEMSLVGPRPHAIGMKTGDVESAHLVAEYAHRHRIKPGMTGWAAIHGSRGPLHEAEDVLRRVALDVEYIERQSFWLDMTIMARTIPSLLGDRSAIR